MQTNDKQENVAESANTFCCGTEGLKGMSDCCKGEVMTDDCCSMMSKGAKACRWFPVIPVVFGIALLLLGYYLDAEMTRFLWMLLAGSLVLLGIFGIFLAGRMKKMCCG